MGIGDYLKVGGGRPAGDYWKRPGRLIDVRTNVPMNLDSHELKVPMYFKELGVAAPAPGSFPQLWYLRTDKEFRIYFGSGKLQKDIFCHPDVVGNLIYTRKLPDGLVYPSDQNIDPIYGLIRPIIDMSERDKEVAPLKLVFDSPFIALLVLNNKNVRTYFDVDNMKATLFSKAPKREEASNKITQLEYFLVKHRGEDWEKHQSFVNDIDYWLGQPQMDFVGMFQDEESRRTVGVLRDQVAKREPFKKSTIEKMTDIFKQTMVYFDRDKMPSFPFGIDRVEVILERAHADKMREHKKNLGYWGG